MKQNNSLIFIIFPYSLDIQYNAKACLRTLPNSSYWLTSGFSPALKSQVILKNIPKSVIGKMVVQFAHILILALMSTIFSAI